MQAVQGSVLTHGFLSFFYVPLSPFVLFCYNLSSSEPHVFLQHVCNLFICVILEKNSSILLYIIIIYLKFYILLNIIYIIYYYLLLIYIIDIYYFTHYRAAEDNVNILEDNFKTLEDAVSHYAGLFNYSDTIYQGLMKGNTFYSS